MNAHSSEVAELFQGSSHERMIVAHNELVRHMTGMSKASTVLLFALLSKFNHQKRKPGMVLTLSRAELQEWLGVNTLNKSFAVARLQELSKNNYAELHLSENKILFVPWFKSFLYDKGVISAELNPDMLPLISKLNSDFTQTRTQAVKSLASGAGASMHLYWHLSYLSRPRQVVTADISIDSMKEAMGIKKTSYRKEALFYSTVVAPAIDVINKDTELIVTCTKNKFKRAPIGYQVTVRIRTQHKLSHE